VTAIGSVTCPFARAGMALALAMYGDSADVPTLIQLLRDERRPESLHDLALALGLQGSPETADLAARAPRPGSARHRPQCRAGPRSVLLWWTTPLWL